MSSLNKLLETNIDLIISYHIPTYIAKIQRDFEVKESPRSKSGIVIIFMKKLKVTNLNTRAVNFLIKVILNNQLEIPMLNNSNNFI